MAIQTATTGQLDEAQGIIISMSRFTQEHNMPTAGLVENFKLTKGNKQITVPKVGQMTAVDLVDGQDIVDSEAIGMTTTDLTGSEVGLKVIITDKLARQENEDVFKIIGRQMGDAKARKKERDLQALFSGLNGGTTLGEDNKSLTLQNAQNCVIHATSNKYPTPVSVLHHPNAIGYLAQQTMAVAMTYYAGIMPGVSEELLRNFWRMNINGVNFFQSGEIDKITDVDSGYGAIFSKSALCILQALEPSVERERDASLRATEVVIVSDYGVFELDDTYGAPMRYEIAALSTAN